MYDGQKQRNREMINEQKIQSRKGQTWRRDRGSWLLEWSKKHNKRRWLHRKGKLEPGKEKLTRHKNLDSKKKEHRSQRLGA
jgi:hypothetical protein